MMCWLLGTWRQQVCKAQVQPMLRGKSHEVTCEVNYPATQVLSVPPDEPVAVSLGHSLSMCTELKGVGSGCSWFVWYFCVAAGS